MVPDPSSPRQSAVSPEEQRSAPCASIVVPTRSRPDYLRVALASIAPQARRVGAELIVVDDAGSSEEGRQLAERFGALYVPHPRPLGLNVARNTGVERSRGELVVFLDDDVEVRDGWLDALMAGTQAHPEFDVFTGPILARLEGSPPRSCGREAAPITTLDLGAEDTATRFAWGANMAIRRAALERVGAFDTSLEHGGDEQEWQERAGGNAQYVGSAALEHRRSPRDSHLVPLCRSAYARGRAARRFDAWRGEAPTLIHEMRILGGCLGHVLRYRCPAGLTMVAHSAGRCRERLRAAPPPRARGAHTIATQTDPSDDFLSGESGTIGGLDALRRRALDAGAEAFAVASGRHARLDRVARRDPRHLRVLALCIARPERERLVARIRAELAHSRHIVDFYSREPDGLGKFENLNLLLASHPAGDHDWLVVIDDDIILPGGFLDRFLFLAERFRLDLVQPAHQLASHAAWRVTRRRPRSAVRETRFVEIGPVTAFRHSTFSTLLPFPPLRMGWGLDMHWGALAREAGWRCGVVDATPISHTAAPAGSAYPRTQALAEARAFLADQPHLSAREAQQTLVTHRRW